MLSGVSAFGDVVLEALLEVVEILGATSAAQLEVGRTEVFLEPRVEAVGNCGALDLFVGVLGGVRWFEEDWSLHVEPLDFGVQQLTSREGPTTLEGVSWDEHGVCKVWRL